MVLIHLTLFLQLALSILATGILCVYINYDCDRQRQEFRRTNGKCLVWGKAPSKVFCSDFFFPLNHCENLLWPHLRFEKVNYFLQ